MHLTANSGDGFSFKRLASSLGEMSRKQSTLLIGIDGCGGSGKSTFAERLNVEFRHAAIVHMDDFYLPSAQITAGHPAAKAVGADFDWRRLARQVLDPISQDREGQYQRYDWAADALAEWHTVPVGGIVIIEGVYAIRNELAGKYDFMVWVDCPREIRLARGLARDGEEARQMWEHNWMVAEDIYMEAHKPRERADLVVNGWN